MKKIVFLVNGYFPDYSTNGICVKKIIDQFSQEYEIHIIAQKTAPDVEYIEKNEKVIIHRVETKEIMLRRELYKKINLSKIGITKKIYNMELQGIRLWFWCLPFFQRYTIKKELIRAYYTELKKMDQIDVIIPVCFPIEALIAGSKYRKERKDIKLGCILFDKFSTNIAHQKNKWNMNLKFRNHVALEEKLFTSMDFIVSTYDWKNYIESFHIEVKKKVQYIDIPALKEFIDCCPQNDEYAYCGMVDRNIRPVTEVLKILDFLNIDKVKYSFAVKGNVSNEIQNFCETHENCIFYGTLPVEKSYAVQSACKGLISIGNTDITQTPSKIYEYMCTGKPIIHFFYNGEDRCIQLLKRYGNAMCINVNNYSEADIINLREFIKNSNLISVDDVFKKFKEADPRYAASLIIENI